MLDGDVIHVSRRLALRGVFGAPQLPPDFRWLVMFALCCVALWAPHLPPDLLMFVSPWFGSVWGRAPLASRRLDSVDVGCWV